MVNNTRTLEIFLNTFSYKKEIADLYRVFFIQNPIKNVVNLYLGCFKNSKISLLILLSLIILRFVILNINNNFV